MTRRDLLRSAGAAALPVVSQSRVWGNNRVSIGLIGCGARAMERELVLPA